MRDKWEIEVSAGSYYISFADNFHSNDIIFYHEHDEHCGYVFFACSPHIEELDDIKQVSKRIYSLELLINGVLRLSAGNMYDYSYPIKLNRFGSNESSFRSVDAEEIEEFPFYNIKNNRTKRMDNDYKSYMLHISKKDNDLRNIIFLAGLISTNTPIEKILTWNTLFKIVESVNFVSKKNQLDFNDFGNIARIDSFRFACNNMSVLGLNSRHGNKDSSNKPPKGGVITNLSEAISVILAYASNFCIAYIEKKHEKKFKCKKFEPDNSDGLINDLGDKAWDINF